MTYYGITPTGPNRPSAATINEDFQAGLKAIFGDEIAVGPQFEGSSVAMGLSGLMADVLSAHCWEPWADLVANLTPESANNFMLDVVKSISKTARIKAAYSTVLLRLGTTEPAPVEVPAGFIGRKSADNTNWITTQAATIPAGGVVDVPARSEIKGPFTAPAGSIDSIVTTIAGVDTITNIADAEIGRETEQDASLRPRTEKRGSGPAQIREALLRVTGLTFAAVQTNPLTSPGEVDGIPRGAHRIYTEGGEPADIAMAIYLNKGGVAGTVGTDYYDITDNAGNVERIYYTPIAAVPVYFIVNIGINGNFPVDGDARIKSGLVSYNAQLENGRTLYNWPLDGSFKDVPGIETCEILQGLTDPPSSSANLTPSITERFFIDAANITVVHV